MTEIIRGAMNSPESTKILIDIVEKFEFKRSILYIGYPIIGSEYKSSVDALLISLEHGLIIFDIVEESTITDRATIRDDLYNVIFQKLLGYKELVKRRGELKIKIHVFTFAPSWRNQHRKDDTIITIDDFRSKLKTSENEDFNEGDFKLLIQSLQAITKLKNKLPRKITHKESKGELLNELEKSISNLDHRQSQAIIETVDGVQRIRGLAGSGKTIVLALKVAYLHSKFPDWTIGVTYYTRSLRNQFIELITKFTIEHKSEEPDWSKVKILQAWGSSRDNGLYYEFCLHNNIEYLDYDNAKRIYGNKNLIEEICEKAINEVKGNYTEIYDAILIDEAQDFTESFLKLCYNMLKPASNKNPSNKRLVYAYDELQKISDLNTLKNPKEIFPGIDFDNENYKQDIFLEYCYRNSSPLLVTAHALGFGIYRENNQLVTMFSDKELWKDVGYIVDRGKLELGNEVVLKRDKESNLDYLSEKVSLEELITFRDFNNTEDQKDYLVNEIIKNLNEDDLNFKDIIVIHPNAIMAKNELAPIRNELFKKKIASHLAGVNTSPDEFFIENSIAFTSIYRAKGNEAAMVYVVNAEYCYGGAELIKKRNILFTAITRSKGWVKVLGIGNEMQKLKNEFEKVKNENYRLRFKYPTIDEMKKLNVLHRDLSESDKKNIIESKKELANLVKKISNKSIHIEDLPQDTLDQLRNLLSNAD